MKLGRRSLLVLSIDHRPAFVRRFIMAIRRRSIKLLAHERSVLVELYLKWRTPIEQFESRPDDRAAFIQEWNNLSGRNDSAADIIHYMRTQRKRGLWVTFDGDHRCAPPQPSMTAEEIESLVSVYEHNVSAGGSGSDVIAYDETIQELIVNEFHALTGRTFTADELNS